MNSKDRGAAGRKFLDSWPPQVPKTKGQNRGVSQNFRGPFQGSLHGAACRCHEYLKCSCGPPPFLETPICIHIYIYIFVYTHIYICVYI